jgi:hypothetical protein
VPNQFVKNTLGAETETIVGVFGSSITGAFSFNERWKSYVQTAIHYLRERGFNIRMIDYSINGGTLYSSASTTFTYPGWYLGSGSRDSNRNIDKAITDGITHALFLHDNNDTQSGHVGANQEGLNVYGEEQIDLFAQYGTLCDANSIPYIFATNNTNLTDTPTPVANFKLVSDNMKAVWDASGQPYLDIFYTMGNPADSYKGFAADYLDNVHWNLDNGTGIGHGKVAAALQQLLIDTYDLTEAVYELTEDKPCVAESGNPELLISDSDGTAIVEDKTGKFVFGIRL